MSDRERETGCAALQEGAACSAREGGEERHIYFEPCEEARVINVTEDMTETGARALGVKIRLAKLCPDRRVVVGVTVCEIDREGEEHPMGLRTMVVPAHRRGKCCELELPMLTFLLPDCLSDAECEEKRHFVVRTLAYPLDTEITLKP